MNKTIETLLKHRSIRKFKDHALSDEQIRTIVSCAQAASTSSYIQAYSIIGIKNDETKEKLAEIVGNQPYVAKNGHFFVFCADLNRHEKMAETEKKDITMSLESTETFMVALIDTALAAQNAAIAAESMGLGICYIGGLRNNLPEVSKLLNLPKRTLPLFGLAVGYPNHLPSQKQRLPFEHIYHEETYQHDEQTLQQYDQDISAYYNSRTDGKRTETWSQQMTHMLSNPKRLYMNDYVKGKGFDLK